MASGLTEPRIVLSLTAPPNLTFDLWKGFSGGDIYINLRSVEIVSSDQPPPLIEYAAAGLNYGRVSPVWALTKELLVIKDELGRPIPINSDALLDLIPYWNSTISFLRGPQGDDIKIDQFPRRLLKELRPRLTAGHSYTLGFQEVAFPIQATTMAPDNKRLQLFGDDHWVNAVCDSDPITFQVVPGTPIPRFSVALSTSSKRMSYTDTSDDFEINIRLTLLENRPTQIKLSDSSFGMRFGGIESWIVMYAFENRSVSLPWTSCPTNACGGQTWHAADGTTLAPCPDVLIFHQGTSYVCRCRVRVAAFESFWDYRDPRVAIRILSEHSGCKSWRPFDEKHRSSEQDEWPSNGPIEFEPVVEGWDEIEKILEQQQPMPLFRLPSELRRMIYDYAKFSREAEEVFFKYQGRVGPRRPKHRVYHGWPMDGSPTWGT